MEFVSHVLNPWEEEITSDTRDGFVSGQGSFNQAFQKALLLMDAIQDLDDGAEAHILSIISIKGKPIRDGNKADIERCVESRGARLEHALVSSLCVDESDGAPS